jgi:two-component system, chemotaxis family, protein-glutamate methylesterase/glutaminase
MRPGHIHIAPPDHHLLVQGDRLLVRKGPKENRFRPSIDALFRSAAFSHGPRAIGIVLSGAMDDGAAGMWDIKCVGGTTIVQSPEEATFPSMPQSALDQVDIDHCLPAREIGTMLARLIPEPLSRETFMEHQAAKPQMERMKLEVDVAAGSSAFREGIMRIGPPSPYTCPECQGVLMEVRDGNMPRFRCHTGHAYSGKSLLAAALERIEQNYGHAMASLEEAAMLLDGMGRAHSRQGDEARAARYFHHAGIAVEQSDRLREVIQENELFEKTAAPGPGGESC